MVKKIKYAIANYKVVSLKTGKLLPNQERYEIKENTSGRQTIYKDGKFVGYANKGSTKQQTRINELAGQRAKRESELPQFERTTKVKLKGEFETLVHRQEEVRGLPLTQVPVSVKSVINYANYLNDAMNAGDDFITEKEAREWLQKYKDANTDEERTELWRKVKKFLIEQGYQDSR